MFLCRALLKASEVGIVVRAIFNIPGLKKKKKNSWSFNSLASAVRQNDWICTESLMPPTEPTSFSSRPGGIRAAGQGLSCRYRDEVSNISKQ